MYDANASSSEHGHFAGERVMRLPVGVAVSESVLAAIGFRTHNGSSRAEEIVVFTHSRHSARSEGAASLEKHLCIDISIRGGEENRRRR